MVYVNATYRLPILSKQKHICKTDCQPNEDWLRHMQSKNIHFEIRGLGIPIYIHSILDQLTKLIS